MLKSKTDFLSNWLLKSIFATAWTLVVCSTASAQQQQPQRPTQPNTDSAATGDAILDPEAVFGGEVSREGAVGQFTEAVGASVTSAAAALGTTGGRAGGGFTGGGMGGLGGLGAAFGNNLTTGAAGGSEAAPIRTRLRSAVVLPPASIESQISHEINVNQRLQRTSTLGPRSRDRGQFLPGQGNVAADRPHYGVHVQMQGRTAILQGTVSSASDRRMSELLIRLEPGVSQVENRINVAE